LLLVAASGRAQPRSTAREEASVHFDRGIELVSEEAYTAAAAEFERAYALSSVPAVLYNLGMAYAAAQRPVEATSALERYMQLADAIPESEQRRIEAELARQRARIGQVELVVQPEGAVVLVDGRDVGTSPLREPLRLGVGEHRIEASRADYERAERVLTVVGGQSERVEIALRSLSAPKPAPAHGVAPLGRNGLEVSPDREPTSRELTLAPAETRQLDVRTRESTRDSPPTAASVAGQRSMAYVLGAGAVGLGIAALAVYLAADGKYDRWNREDKSLAASATRSDTTVDDLDQRQRDNDNLLKSIWKMDTTAGALAIGGGCLLLVGGIVLWTAETGGKSEAPRLQVGLRGVGVDVRSSL
jgi:hypothetical protein